MRYQKPPTGAVLNPLHPLSRGLVGMWLFNEGAGSLANDISGNKNHGRLKNMAPNVQGSGWGGSKFGGGLKINGANDHVDCGNDASLDITDAITLSARVKLNVLNDDYKRVAHKNTAYSLTVNNVDSSFYLWNYGSGYNSISDSGVLSVGQWQHLVIVKDSISGVVFYVNGVESGTDTSGSAKALFSTSNVNLMVGIDEDLSSHPLNGSIDEVRIYNRALLAEEVKMLDEQPFCNLSN